MKTKRPRGTKLIKINKVAKGNVVIVDWTDATNYSGWHFTKSKDFPGNMELVKVKSIGVVIHISDNGITITGSLTDGGSTMDPLTIPKVAIEMILIVPSLSGWSV